MAHSPNSVHHIFVNCFNGTQSHTFFTVSMAVFMLQKKELNNCNRYYIAHKAKKKHLLTALLHTQKKVCLPLGLGSPDTICLGLSLTFCASFLQFKLSHM